MQVNLLFICLLCKCNFFIFYLFHSNRQETFWERCLPLLLSFRYVCTYARIQLDQHCYKIYRYVCIRGGVKERTNERTLKTPSETTTTKKKEEKEKELSCRLVTFYAFPYSPSLAPSFPFSEYLSLLLCNNF